MTFGTVQAMLVSILLTPPTLSAATVSGKVADVSGGAIDAFIFAYDNNKHDFPPGSLPGTSVTADRSGRFALQLAPGFYDICAFAPGFSADCRKVLIKDAAEQRSLDLRLTVDPLVIKERGDYFPSR